MKSNQNYASFFEVNRSVNPGIRVLIDFLNNYFPIELKSKDIISLEKIKNLGDIIICKESEQKTNDILFNSFKEWVESYCYFHSSMNKNKAKYFIPLTKKMIYGENQTRERLRNILFRLLYINCGEDKNNQINKDKELIEKYLFLNSNNNNIYGNIVNILNSIIGEIATDPNIGKDRIFKESSNNDGLKKSSSKLADTFRKDFEALLTHDIFSKKDIYRKINLFSLLLNFYVTLYAINRAFDGEEVFILAKGSPDFSTDSGRFHYASLGNFSNIRERIFKLSEKYFENKIEYSNMRIRINTNDEIEILSKEGKEENNIWPELKAILFESKLDKVITNIIKDYLELTDEYKSIPKKALAKAVVEVSKKRSSSVRMISSIFSGQGKEAKMVYPVTSVRQKYYAMSSELTELLLNLFLASLSDGLEFATLDMFLSWLETRYGIYISFSDKLMDYFSKNSIKEPSNIEFFQNVEAFISTLKSISAIEKLSDNSFLVYESGRLGGLSWLI